MCQWGFANLCIQTALFLGTSQPILDTLRMIDIQKQNPGPDGVIRRSDRTPDTPPGLSRYQQSVVHQGRIERFFLDNIQKYSEDGIKIERGVVPESLIIDESRINDQAAYPVTVKLRHLSEEEATPKQIGGGKIADGLFRSNLFSEADEDALIQRSYERAGKLRLYKRCGIIG